MTLLPTPTHGPPRSLAAYEELLPEILAVTEESIPPILIDIPTAVTTVLGALPRIRALRPELVETLRKFDFAEFDRLEQYTLALSHAHARHRAAHEPKLSLSTMARELTGLRDMLLSDARSLGSHGLIKAERLAGCRATPGYRALAYDVLMLVQVLRESWNDVHDRTPVTLDELYEAAAAAEKLLRAVGLRDQAAPTVAEATVLRRKAFGLFLRVYARARAAVQYLRAEIGDADDIAPSLYAGRVKRRKSEGEPTEGSPASSGSGNGPGTITPPAEESGEDAALAVERPAAAEAGGRADAEASSAAGDGTRAGVAQLLGMRCWGAASFGQLGDGTVTVVHPEPTRDVLTDVRAISAGGAHTCALMNTGGVRCWGWNRWGQLGERTATFVSKAPTTYVLAGVAAIAAGGDHTCALMTTGRVRCWGADYAGQLGRGHIPWSSVAQPVPGTCGR
jgi:hypothetical protein